MSGRYRAYKTAEHLMLENLDRIESIIDHEACEGCRKKMECVRDDLLGDIGVIQDLIMED